MSTFDQSADRCNQKLAAILLLVDDLKREHMEINHQILKIVARLEDFKNEVYKDGPLDNAVRILDQILSEFGR
jgi:hypothetical protein